MALLFRHTVYVFSRKYFLRCAILNDSYMYQHYCINYSMNGDKKSYEIVFNSIHSRYKHYIHYSLTDIHYSIKQKTFKCDLNLHPN